jgi:hypothetical protein
MWARVRGTPDHVSGHLTPHRCASLVRGATASDAERNHLQRCDACRQQLRRARFVTGLLDDCGSMDLDELAARRMELRLNEARQAPLPAPRRTRARTAGWGAVAAVLLVVPIATAVWSSGKSESADPVPTTAARPTIRWSPPSPEVERCEWRPELGPSVVWGRAPSWESFTPPPSAFAQPAPLSSGPVRSTSPHDAPHDAPHDEAAPNPAAPEPSAPAPPEPAAQLTERSSTYGDLEVTTVEGPSLLARRLEAAQRAFYVDDDPVRGAKLAGQARALAAEVEQERVVNEIECNAWIAAREFERALPACRRLLAGTTGDRRRSIHFMLGSLYRKTGDCVAAVGHYDQSILFGAPTLTGHEARQFRAECALRLGRLDAAERDVAYLELNPALVSRPRELARLREQLRRAREAARSTDAER